MRCALALVVFLSLAGAPVWAEDFWLKTKFTEWSDKDVQKMLRDSPWARPVSVQLGGGGMGGMGGGGGRGGRGGGGGGADISAAPSASDDLGGGMGGMGGGRGRGGGQSMESIPSHTVTVRWLTALPVRQALARMRFGKEAGTSPEAAKMLQPEERRYVVGLADLPPQLLMRSNPAELKSKATLRVKGREPLVATEAVPERGQRGATLYLVFPRPGFPITLDDKDVEVVLKLTSVEIKRRFRLKDMLFDGRLEL
jgi:hypothetical protein